MSLMDLAGFEGLSSGSFLGETEGPFLGADLRTGPPGAQAGSRRLRAAGVEALTPPSTRRGWSSGRAGRGVRLGFEPVDELLEHVLEPGIVVLGMVTDDVDGAAVVVGGLAMIAAGFADHAEAVVAVMDIGEARQQIVGGLLGGIEVAGVNHVDDGVGRLGQFVKFVMFLAIAGQERKERRHRVWLSGQLGGTCGTGGGLIAGHAALFVFLAAIAGAEIIPSDFGHLANFSSKDGPSVPSRAGRHQVP